MADLGVVTPERVAPLKVVEQYTGPAGEAIDAGEICGIDDDGTVILAIDDAGAPVLTKGIALSSAIVNQEVTILRDGWVDLGDIFVGMDIGDSLWAGSVAGLLADAQTVAHEVLGEVVAVLGDRNRFNRVMRIRADEV